MAWQILERCHIVFVFWMLRIEKKDCNYSGMGAKDGEDKAFGSDILPRFEFCDCHLWIARFSLLVVFVEVLAVWFLSFFFFPFWISSFVAWVYFLGSIHCADSRLYINSEPVSPTPDVSSPSFPPSVNFIGSLFLFGNAVSFLSYTVRNLFENESGQRMIKGSV